MLCTQARCRGPTVVLTGCGRKGHGSPRNCRIPFRGGSRSDSASWFALVIYGTINVIPDCDSTCVFVFLIFFHLPWEVQMPTDHHECLFFNYYCMRKKKKNARLISNFGICFFCPHWKRNAFSDPGAFARIVSVNSAKPLEEPKLFLLATTGQPRLFS